MKPVWTCPLELFDEISKKTPYLTKLSPGGTFHMIDVQEVGGIRARHERTGQTRPH